MKSHIAGVLAQIRLKAHGGGFLAGSDESPAQRAGGPSPYLQQSVSEKARQIER